MTDQKEDQQSNGVRGLMFTIDQKGAIHTQVMGTLNEAEYLGIGAFSQAMISADGFRALSLNQKDIVGILNHLVEAVALLKEVEKEEEESICGKEPCLDCCHSQDSGPSLESSQEQSEE